MINCLIVIIENKKIHLNFAYRIQNLQENIIF